MRFFRPPVRWEHPSGGPSPRFAKVGEHVWNYPPFAGLLRITCIRRLLIMQCNEQWGLEPEQNEADQGTITTGSSCSSTDPCPHRRGMRENKNMRSSMDGTCSSSPRYSPSMRPLKVTHGSCILGIPTNCAEPCIIPNCQNAKATARISSRRFQQTATYCKRSFPSNRVWGLDPETTRDTDMQTKKHT